MFLRHIARPMLATWFIYDGIHAAVAPSDHVAAARRGADMIAERVPQVPTLSDKQVAQVVRAHGIATAVAGLFLATSKAPRTASLTLAALTVPLAVVNQPIGGSGPWSDRTHRFVANVGAIGAALIAGADYEGRPGVSWRVAKARREMAAARAVARDSAKAAEAGKSVRRAALRAAHKGHGLHQGHRFHMAHGSSTVPDAG